MNDITMTVMGNVVNDVEMRFTAAGDAVASFRVASTSRRYDRASERWVDGDTAYFSVSCWRQFAHHVSASITKGMPVVVVGRLRSREVERPCGEQTHLVRFHDIEATAVGPDLSRGTAVFTKVKRESLVESEERRIADALAAAAEAGVIAGVDLATGEITELTDEDEAAA